MKLFTLKEFTIFCCVTVLSMFVNAVKADEIITDSTSLSSDSNNNVLSMMVSSYRY